MLLLDEPVSGMNASETHTFVQLVRNIRDRGVTILLVEHDMPMVMERLRPDRGAQLRPDHCRRTRPT